MCGICGVLSFEGRPVEPATIDAMTAVLAHRGPDESGRHADGPVALGHTRLKIIDLSAAARQPMENDDGSLVIVFNGEIYNFRDLRRRLAAAGHVFRSQSDTEVILRLYEQEGERCVDELDGMFAFGLWDRRRAALFLARDRVGKKPLFYYRDHRIFAFASEIKALLRHPGVPADVNESAVVPYFIHGYVPTPATFYRDILSVPPGHRMTVEGPGGVRMRGYWDLRFGAKGSDGHGPSDATVAGEVRALTTEAVRKRLVADVPIGAFLSGGIDSSIVVGLMSRLVGEPVKTFSIGFAGDPAFDETPYARAVARHFATDHTEFVVEPKAVDLIETLVWHHDGPFGDPSGIPTYIVSELTRQHVTVALNGDGGDELFAGYLRFAGAVAAERIPALALRAASRVASGLPEPRSYHHPLRRAQRFFENAAAPLHERFSRWISLFYDDVDALVDRDLVAATGGPVALAPFRAHLGPVAGATPLAQLLYLNMKTYLVDDLLVKMDRTSMAHGLETRSPFLDRDLMEYAAGLPDRMKLRRWTTKYILRRAFADLLPREILTRGKRGFGVPLGAWFRGELREFLLDHLLAPDAAIKAYLNVGYVGKLVDEHLRGVRDHGHRLWAVLTFEVWLRLLRGAVVAPGEARRA